ncbi:lytic transglycosylase domain-containing protein [Novosphingobium sp. AP12]|uniref:lytic transglycosylase domain-containing protein n=1 Tax=Novosphingobium sp. AP12 TaxID=1144305 RepID=UPI001EE66BE3|nr:lytic transglycosylase domain-containing protein [Novosphingobium sp. AP12]
MIVDPTLRRLLPLASLLVSVSHAEGRASPSDHHEARLAQCIQQAAGGRAWLERTLWGLRDQEAGWIGAEIANTNGTHDLGPLQVNSSWVARLSSLVGREPALVRKWLIHDPCFNVQAAKWIFLSGLRVTHDYWKAVGVYHSPTPERQLRYRKSVAQRLVSRFGGAVFHLATVVSPQSLPLETDHADQDQTK